MLLAAGVPTVAHADAAGPTEFRTKIVSIEPATPTIALSIEGGDSFVRIEVAPGTDVVVLGYDGEPYTWIDADGLVYENRLSMATYYNDTRLGTDAIPDFVDADAEPEWERVGDGGRWAWHDHRAHWMGAEPPLNMDPGDSLPQQTIPLVVDGSEVAVAVVSTLVGDPSPWPSVLGAAGGIALATLAVLRRRTAVEALAFAAMALAVGLAQFLSLPPETGPRPIWFLPPAVAVVAAGLAWWWRRTPLFEHGLVLLAAAQLLLWTWVRRLTFVRPVLPTDAPYWLDRALTAGVAAGATVLLGAAVGATVGLLRQPRAASIAAFRSS